MLSLDDNNVILTSNDIRLLKNHYSPKDNAFPVYIKKLMKSSQNNPELLRHMKINLENCKRLIGCFLDNENKVPEVVENILLNHLRLIVLNKRIDSGLNYEDVSSSLKYILSFVDEDKILEYNTDKKHFQEVLLYYKFNDLQYEYEEDNVITKISDYPIDSMNNHNIHIMGIEENDDNLVFFGFFRGVVDSHYLSVEAVKTDYITQEQTSFYGKKVMTSFVEDTNILSKSWVHTYSFCVKVPCDTNNAFYVDLKVNFHKDKNSSNFNENNLVSYYSGIKILLNSQDSENVVHFTDNKNILLRDGTFIITRKFLFSIVMALYNTGVYLYESIDSIINQTLDFEENVQLVLVDDGSEDNSLSICNEYKKKYPNNIFVISQDNGGQASARNHGMIYSTGRYVNFLDSDDYLSRNTLEKVNEFFEKHYDDIDLISVPIILFGRTKSQHVLNDKFKKTRVIDLNGEPNNPQLSIASAFVKNKVIVDYTFNTTLVSSEDTLLVNKILFNKGKYGVISDVFYYYRQRGDASSTTDTVASKKEYFTPRLKNHFMELINYSLEKKGFVPDYIQYLLAYNLQWMLNQSLDCMDTDEEIEEFWHYLHKVVGYIDDDKILWNKYFMDRLRKFFFLYVKYGEKFDKRYADNSVLLDIANQNADNLRVHKLWLDIVELDTDCLRFSGSLNSLFDSDYISIDAVLESDEKIVKVVPSRKTFYTTRQDLKFLSKTWEYRYTFDLDIPLKDFDKVDIRLRVNYHKNKDKNDYSEDNVVSSYLLPDFRLFTKISHNSNYIVKNSRMLIYNDRTFKIRSYSYSRMLKEEYKVLKNIYKNKTNSYKYALFLRSLYTLLYPFYRNKSRNLYLFMDRITQADDNAEHLFRYALKQKDGIKKIFVVSEDSKDKSRLSKIGEVVSYNSFKHRLYFLFAEKIISSHPDESTLNPFISSDLTIDEHGNYAGLITSKRYYIRHGVAKDNMSSWLRKFDKNVALLLTSSDYERESFMEDGYNYDSSIIQTLGLPRYDNLSNEEDKKQVLFIPTWRRGLNDKETFVDSDYYKALNDILSDENLISLIEKYGYTFVFKAHPNIEKEIEDSGLRYIDLFDINENIKISTKESYQELFNKSSLLITDYSSVFFDFGYLKKPIIYYRPNDDYHFEQGYFNWETMGFGEVIKDKDSLTNKIEYYLDNNCLMEEKYKNRVDSFFKYSDKNNCQRVYDWIRKN